MKPVSINRFMKTLPTYKITKHIRLIELFGGVGSQAMALRDLGVPFEHYRLVEFDKYPIASYNAIHRTDFKPTDIKEVKGSDLGIVDKDKYEYLLTYSFPCTDLSLAGKQLGMSKDSGTRSGLLWEVERLLNEVEELPQVLVMENVPQVLAEKNKPDFDKWIDFLVSKGYSNYYEVLNASDYGIPQNRRRCFMVSILGKYSFNFPKPVDLTKKMKDLLEKNVDSKYFIVGKAEEVYDNFIKDSDLPLDEICIGGMQKHQAVRDTTICTTLTASMGTGGGYVPMVCESELPKERFFLQALNTLKSNDIKNGDIIDAFNERVNHSGICPTITTRPEGFKTGILPVIEQADKTFAIRKLTPKECWRIMDFTDDDFEKARQVNSDCQLYKQAGNSIVKRVLMAIFGQLVKE